MGHLDGTHSAPDVDRTAYMIGRRCPDRIETALVENANPGLTLAAATRYR
jgi:hypothetical protein